MASNRDTWIGYIFSARVLMYTNFMVYAAALPVLIKEWSMSATQAGTVASGFMAGYAVSLFVSSWLADHYGAKRIFMASAALSAVTALLFGFFARSYVSGFWLYTLAASTQGGLYTPAIMLFADRYEPARRGAAVGYLIASTSIGYAFSLTVSGLCLSVDGYRAAFIVTGCLPVLGVLLCWYALRDTPNRVHPRPVRVTMKQALWRNRDARYLVGGYTAHCWELLGMWSWTPAFFAAAYALNGSADSAEFGAYLTASMHIVGSAASAYMGRWSDRWGRRRILLIAASISMALSMCLGWLIYLPLALLVGLGMLYYFTALGDSPVWSTAVSEVVDPSYLGMALALRALLGFSAGAIAPVVFGMVLDATAGLDSAPSQWGLAFMSLGMGGVLAVVCASQTRPPQRSSQRADLR